MTWREDLRRVTIDGRILVGASFRGVPFLVEDETKSGGRRLVVHEFPLRDSPVIQDMGRRTRQFRVDGYVIGDNYLDQRDALVAALEEPGAGILVHPEYADDLRVRSSGYSVQTSRTTAAIARFSLDFIESPLDQIVLALEDSPDLAGATVATAQALDVASETQLLESLVFEGIPSYARQSQAADIDAVATALGDALGALSLGAQERAALQAAVADIVSNSLALVIAPTDMLNGFRSTLATVPDLLEATPRAVIAALFAAHDTPDQPLAIGETPIRDTERANQIQVGSALRRWAITEAAQIAVAHEYETEEDALTDRQGILQRIDEQAANAGDAVFPQMQELRASFALAVPGNRQLARIIDVERKAATPAILLSYQLYGTTQEDTAIFARNAFQHPSFLSGSISVLSEAT